jgi:hypothetical protein
MTHRTQHSGIAVQESNRGLRGFCGFKNINSCPKKEFRGFVVHGGIRDSFLSVIEHIDNSSGSTGRMEWRSL